jgi:hypothetical protein
VQADDRSAIKGDGALTRDESSDGSHGGRLAGAVGAEHDDNLALVDAERDAVQHQ